MNSFEKITGEMLEKGQIAATVFQQLNRKETDKIVENVYWAGFNARVRLAKMAFHSNFAVKLPEMLSQNLNHSFHK